MTPFEYVLQKLAEECSELAMAASELAQHANSLSQHCGKAMLFGISSSHPDRPLLDNRSQMLRELTRVNDDLQRVLSELEDVNAVAAVLRQLDELDANIGQLAKLDELTLTCSAEQLRRMQIKLRKWAKHVPNYLIRHVDGVTHVVLKTQSSEQLRKYIEATIENIESLLKAKNDGFSF